MRQERKYGFEIESHIVHQNKDIFVGPTIPDVISDDNTLLGRGFLHAGRRTRVQYTTLYTFWGDFEIVVDPFKGQHNLSPLFSQAYDIVLDLPSRYKPWVQSSPDVRGGRIALSRQTRTAINKIDLSVQVALSELGVTETELPPPLERSPSELSHIQWWMSRFPYQNDALRDFLESPFHGIRTTTSLRNMRGAYVLHSSLNVQKEGLTFSKKEITEAAEGFVQDMSTALGRKKERRYFFGITL